MSRTAAAHVGIAPEPVAASGILTLIAAIERHGAASPAAAAFRSALRRKGIEADAAGSLQALDALMAEVAEADPERADARVAILRAAWADLLPGVGGRSRV